MSIAGPGVKLYVFVLVLNLVFPIMSYTFTTFGAETDRYETALDPDSLMIIGLNLVDGESHNLTWEGDWIEWTELNTTIRAKWDTHSRFLEPSVDAIRFEKKSAISFALDSWDFSYSAPVKSLLSNEWFDEARNDTIIRDFDPELNWTRFILLDGHHIFITPKETHGNISKAIFEDGTLNVTIAQSFDETEDRFNFWSFIKWYYALLIGSSSWGLPSVFSWIIRILAAVSSLAAILLIKELTRV